jgi:hypothetical protein
MRKHTSREIITNDHFNRLAPWEVQWTDENGPERSRAFKSREEVQRFANKVKGKPAAETTGHPWKTAPALALLGLLTLGVVVAWVLAVVG